MISRQYDIFRFGGKCRLTSKCSRQAAEAPGSVRALASDGAAVETYNCVGASFIVLAADLHFR